MVEIHVSKRVPGAGPGCETPPWATQLSELQGFKVIRKFFLKHLTKVLDGISGITKHVIFFPFEGL